MIWQGIGINYGHQTAYDPAQTEGDFSFLKSAGVTRLRIAMPTFDSTTNLPHCQDMVIRALAHGFYVAWGVECGYGTGTVTASRWANYKNYVLNMLIPWAQSVGLSDVCLDNESDVQADGTTITASQIRIGICSMAESIKTNSLFAGKLSCSTSISETYRDPWIASGIGPLDFIGWNSYDTLSNFNTRNNIVSSAFGAKTYISEFGCIDHGYPDYNNETLWYNDVIARIQSMQNIGIGTGYFFCYRDGGFGLSTNTFAVVLNDGSVRLARNAVLGE